MSRSIRAGGRSATTTAQSLTRVKPEFLGDWKEALRPVRAELLGPLAAIFRNHELGELQQALATSTLADYAADDVRLLADLLEDADPRQFAELFPVLARHGEAAIGELERELDTVVEPRLDRCAAGSRPGGTFRPRIRRAIEASAGMVEERLRLLSDHAAYRSSATSSKQLREMRLSSHCASDRTVVGRSVLVAAVWTRDGRPWQWLGEADAERLRSRDAELRREGYVPIDVSVTVLGGRAHLLATRPSGSKPMSRIPRSV